jgi:hypothetical protein
MSTIKNVVTVRTFEVTSDKSNVVRNYINGNNAQKTLHHRDLCIA